MATGFAKRQQAEWKFGLRKMRHGCAGSPQNADLFSVSLIPAHTLKEQKIIRLARIVSSNYALCFRNYRAFIPKFTALNSGIYDIIQP